MEKSKWNISITPNASPFSFNIQEIVDYKDLILLFVKRDFVTVYRQTVFGPLWHLIQPLLTSFAFYIVFNKIANISTEGIPPLLFYMSATVAWNYFASSVNKSSNVFIGNATIFGKVYFPRITVPISFLISNAISFVFQFAFLMIIAGIYALTGYSININITALLIPVVLFMLGLQGVSIGLIISSLTVKYRDLIFLVSFGIQLLMYLSPVIYTTSSLSPQLKQYMLFNPMAPFLDLFRYSICGAGAPDVKSILISTAVTFVITLVSIFIFNRTERNVVDTL